MMNKSTQFSSGTNSTNDTRSYSHFLLNQADKIELFFIAKPQVKKLNTQFSIAPR